jgi:hypothetical protein
MSSELLLAVIDLAIGKCETVADLEEWKQINLAMIDSLSEVDYLGLKALYQARRADLRKHADAA